jgi:hypothetical protein
MEETFSPGWQGNLGEAICIVFTVIILVIFVLTFSYLRKKPTASAAPRQKPQEPNEPTAMEAPKPEPVLIHCPACDTEISHYAPLCLKCEHPINSMPQNQETTPQTDQNQTIIIQQETPQSNGMGTAGFILALMSLVLSWVPGIGWIVWFLGFLLSFIGMFKYPRGLAIAGFLISIIDLFVLIMIIGALAGVATLLF